MGAWGGGIKRERVQGIDLRGRSYEICRQEELRRIHADSPAREREGQTILREKREERTEQNQDRRIHYLLVLPLYISFFPFLRKEARRTAQEKDTILAPPKYSSPFFPLIVLFLSLIS